MDETIRTVLWSAPISAALASAAIWLLKGWITERLTNAVRHEYDKELEVHKASLKAQFDAELEVRKAALKARSDAELEVHKINAQRWFHIDKSQFDMEFNSFKNLWSAQCALVDATARMVNRFLRSSWEDEGGKLEILAKAADEAFFAVNRANQELGPFMPAEIHRRSVSLAADCKEEIDNFFGALGRTPPKQFDLEMAKRATKDIATGIKEDWEKLGGDIRCRLLSMSMSGPSTIEALPTDTAPPSGSAT